MKIQYIITNKPIFINDNPITLQAISHLKDCWITWKYLIDIKVSNKKRKQSFTKEFFCSISKKTDNTSYLYLNHLNVEELEHELNNLSNNDSN